MQAIVLCAGEGSRLGLNIPKCLVKINGMTVLENIARSVSKISKIVEFVVVTGFKSELVEEEVRHLRSTVHSAIQTVHNKDANKYSIVRSLQVAAPLIHSAVVWRISGDVFFDKKNSLVNLAGRDMTCIAIQKSPEGRGRTPAVSFTLNSDLLAISLEEAMLGNWEWADYEIYKNYDFQKTMIFAPEYTQLGSYHFNLLNRCLQEGMPIRVHDVKGSFEIDTPEDLEYVQRTCSNS